MSYPALDAFEAQITAQTGRHVRVGYALWRVYRALQPPVLNFQHPADVKLVWLADHIHMTRRHVIKALAWLVAEGYLIEHGRDAKGVRSLSLAYALKNAA